MHFKRVVGMCKSLSCEFFGQVPGSVWVIAQRDRRIVRESLQWDNELKCGESGARPLYRKDLLAVASRELQEELLTHLILTVSNDNWVDAEAMLVELPHDGNGGVFVIGGYDKNTGGVLPCADVAEEVVADVQH